MCQSSTVMHCWIAFLYFKAAVVGFICFKISAQIYFPFFFHVLAPLSPLYFILFFTFLQFKLGYLNPGA